MTNTSPPIAPPFVPPFALFIRGPSARIFALSDDLGFEMEMQALAVSVFEDGPDTMHVQALFNTEDEANACEAALDLNGLEHFITQLPNEDWTAKSQAGLPPVIAGRFFIYGSHDTDNIPKQVVFPICINAGLAFGTGHHGTTTGCLLAFEALIAQNLEAEKAAAWPANILDLGCGAGVLAIAAAKALNRNVTATDIDMDAVNVTNDNARINDVAHLITTRQADGIVNGAKYDLIFANILAKPLMLMAPDIAGALAAGGVVILSGLLDEQAQDMITCYEAQDLKLIRRASLKGWTTLSMKRVL